METTTDIPSDPQQEVVVPVDALGQLVVDLLKVKGMQEGEARIASARLMDADLRGIHSHGSRALPRYLKDIDKGFIKPDAKVSVVRETPAMAVLDGGRGLGHIAATQAMELAIDKAQEVGTGTVAIREGNHYGAASVYTLMAIEAGMIGYSTTSTAYATVAAFGSTQPATANNALSWGVPSRSGPPFVLDMACATSSWGKVESLKMYGGQMPEGWGLDAEGKPTTDPAAAKVLLPAAGARGYGLAFLASVLAGPLAGGMMPLHKPWTQSPGQYASEHFFYVVDIKQFVEEDVFYDELDATSAEIRALQPAEGFDQVRLPGELEWERATRWKAEGIPLHRDHSDKLASAAAEFGVELPW